MTLPYTKTCSTVTNDFLFLAQICIFCILLLTMNLTPIYANPICNISLARCSLRRHLLMHSKRYIFEKVIFQVSGKTCATNKNTKMFKYCFTYIIHPLHSYFLLNFDPIRNKNWAHKNNLHGHWCKMCFGKYNGPGKIW